MYLVTEGASFIGSHTVYELLGRGPSVRVLDNFSTGKRDNLREALPHIDLIGRLVLLKEFYGYITVPPAVWREVVEEGEGRVGPSG